MAAPTIQRSGGSASAATAQQGAAKTVAAIPFTRGARKRSLFVNVNAPTFGAAASGATQTQLPAGGWLRYIELQVAAVAAGNAATVAFQNDAPFNVFSQVALRTAAGDSIIDPIDGFTLYAINKYIPFSFGLWFPQQGADWVLTPGAGATGGSFAFTLFIPLEVDARDAYGALQNMAANLSYLLTLSLNASGLVYSTAPTTIPPVTINAIMHYWAAPNATNNNGDLQQTAPASQGTVSLLQVQTPVIAVGAAQNIQLINVGNVVREPLFILRNASGVRDTTQWPNQMNVILNQDIIHTIYRTEWLNKIYDAMPELTSSAQTAAASAAGTTLDAGVFPFIDFINDGGVGSNRLASSQSRNQWLVTAAQTALNIDAHNWGATAGSLLIVQNNVRPNSADALYAPQFQ